MGYLWTQYALDHLIVSLLFVHRPSLLFPSSPAPPFILPSWSVRIYCPHGSKGRTDRGPHYLSCPFTAVPVTRLAPEGNLDEYAFHPGQLWRARRHLPERLFAPGTWLRSARFRRGIESHSALLRTVRSLHGLRSVFTLESARSFLANRR